MKKTLIVALLLMLGLTAQAQTASVNSNQGAKTGQANASETAEIEDSFPGNAVKTQEKNKVKNQGEDSEIQVQQQNTVQNQDSANKKTNNDKSGLNPSGQRRSEVAAAVQTMIQIADREGGIGQQVRTIAQNQNQNQIKLEKNIEKIENRGKFAKFFFGPDYREIKDAQKTLEQSREQIRQLNEIRTQLSNEGDEQQLTEQIRILEEANHEIETVLAQAHNGFGFSLFGWFSKMIQ